MLVNAINHMNVRSHRYIFLDQSLERKDGQIQLLTKDNERQNPKLYFRGAITQVDTNTVSDRGNIQLDLTNAPHPLTIKGGALGNISPSLSRGASIVSVDLHLVSYPEKTVLPGGSVANSMVVTNKTFGTGSTGLIKLTGYNLSLSFNRIESIGQAVRNLIELGVIELLGRHAGVPYWECLNIEPTNEKKQNSNRTAYKATPNVISVIEAQRMLQKLGYSRVTPTGTADKATYAALSKFQSDKRLIATGELNYDTYAKLQQAFRGYPVNGHILNSKPKSEGRSRSTHISLSSKNTNRTGDPFIIDIRTHSDGYLSCFHQSGSGPVTQILPLRSDLKLQVSKNFQRKLPNAKDSFKLEFEKDRKIEKVLCTLQDISAKARPPSINTHKTFVTLPIKKITEITKLENLKDWAIISRSASPKR